MKVKQKYSSGIIYFAKSGKIDEEDGASVVDFVFKDLPPNSYGFYVIYVDTDGYLSEMVAPEGENFVVGEYNGGLFNNKLEGRYGIL